MSVARTPTMTAGPARVRRGHSLTLELILLVSGLVVAVATISAGMAFFTMRRSAYGVASAHLTAANTELARAMVVSVRLVGAATRAMAEREQVRAYLARPGPATQAAAEAALRPALTTEPQTIAIQLLGVDQGSLLWVAAVGARFIPPHGELAWIRASTTGSATVGPLSEIGDSVAFPTAVRVDLAGQVAGYLVHWRRFRTDGLGQVSRLLGARTDVHVGNRRGDLWTDFAHRVDAPAIDLATATGLLSYEHPHLGPVLGVVRPVTNTPWVLLVETPRDVVMAQTRSFLSEMTVIASVGLALGLSGALLLGRRLARPLRRLTVVVEQVAAGDFAQRVGQAAHHEELRRLSEAFDSMVSRLQESFSAQRVAEEYYRRLFDSVPLPLWVFDRETLRFLAVNDAAIEHYGYTRDEFLAMTVADLRAPEDVPRLLTALAAADGHLDSGGAWRHRKQDGTMINVETRAHTIVFGGRRAGIVVVDDVTERNRAADAVRRSEEKYLKLVREVPIGISISALDGRFVSVNRAFVDMFGYASETEALAANAKDLYDDPDEREALLRILRRGERVQRREIAYKRKDGSRVVARYTARLATDPASGEQYIEAISEDVTEQRKVERQLEQAQRMEAVGQLAGGIAHDFNNLLTVIISYSDLLLTTLGDHGPGREEVEAILAAGKRAATLTRQLLIFSRQEVVKPQVMRLNGLVADIGTMLTRLIGENIEFATALDPEAGAVRVDPGQIEQVIVNLVVNARDAMPEGGRLLIETRNLTFAQAFSDRTGSYAAGPYVILVVSDNGIGMSEETRARIFEPFFTTKERGKGTGLGLATVYCIVKQSGGYISVYSEPGKGTSIKLYFPRVGEFAAQVGGLRAPGPVTGGIETVLVTEDDPAVGKAAGVILRRHGYTVLAAPSGESALELAATHPGPIDLLVTDVVLPGMSGRVLADQFATLRPDARILFVSGYTDDALVHHRVLEEGMHYLEKPFTPDGLARKVRQVLDRGVG